MAAKNNTALLVMDVQGGIVKNLGEKAKLFIEKVTKAVEAAREAGFPVFFIVVRFREGYPELSRRNKMHERIKNNSQYSLEGNTSDTQPVIAPEENELVVAKKRISAFAGSDLEMLLQAQQINHLVLCGIATSGVVLSTTRAAADKDYEITILSDCCADRDEEVNRVLLEKVFPTQASVVTSEEWKTSLMS
ncbi:MAG: isochorismatase family cysteine hydrolase [Ginsengibacter sp.]